MQAISRHSWVLLLLVGLGLAYFAYDYIVVIPALDPNDPDRGLEWLTTDPEVIKYVNFHFRQYGYSVLALAVLVIVISSTGFRQGERWAWYSLLYLPIHIGIHMAFWPWTIPILSVVMAMTLVGLLLPFRTFFPPQS